MNSKLIFHFYLLNTDISLDIENTDLRIDTSGGGVIYSAPFYEVWIGYYPRTNYILYVIR